MSRFAILHEQSSLGGSQRRIGWSLSGLRSVSLRSDFECVSGVEFSGTITMVISVRWIERGVFTKESIGAECNGSI